MPQEEAAGGALPRQLGLLQVVTYGIGNIVGAGIYVLVGDAAGLAGTSLWASFIVGAFVAAFTGLTYAELASMYPKAASEYVYLGRAYGSRLLSFITEWTMLFTEIIAASAVSLGFAGYLKAITGVPQVPAAFALLALLTLVASVGARYWLRLNTMLSIVAIAGLVVVISTGMTKLGSVNYTIAPNGITGIIGAAILVFFSYIGFDNISNIAEDTKEPEKTIPRGLVIAVVATTLLYVLVGIASVSLVSPDRLASSQAPLAVAASSALGEYGFLLVSIIALLTTINTVQVLIIVSSRIIYGMAREGALPSLFCTVSRNRKTPVSALLLTFLVAIAFLPLASASAIGKVTSFGALVTFALVNLASIHLRRVAPHVQRAFKAPLNVGWLPVSTTLGLLSCLLLLTQFDRLSMLLGLFLPLSGFLTYVAFARRGIFEVDRSLHEEHFM